MHVLFGLSTFSTLSDPRMGSEVAAATMARYLARRQRIKVTMANILWTGFEPDQFDLVHLWNAGGHKGPYALAARLARAAGRPLLMTPIYWPSGPGDDWGRLPRRERERLLETFKEGMPERYREMLRDYYRRLAAERSR